MGRKIEEYITYNRKTGEIADVVYVPRKRGQGGRWMRLFQDRILELNKTKLRGETFRVLMQLLGLSDFQNQIPGTGEIAEQLSMKRPSVCRAYRELKKEWIVIEEGSKYYLSPFLVWKGTPERGEAWCRELMKPKVKQLEESVK